MPMKRRTIATQTTQTNPDADAYVFGYRMVGIAKAYKNMLSGMYFSHDQA